MARLRQFVLMLTLVAIGATPRVAQARTERELAYRVAEVWGTAVRFVRVDQQYTIVDKDQDAGYILFDYKEDKRTFRGSLEIFRTTSNGREYVRFVIQLSDRPSYHEIALMDRLETKLRAELGEARPAPTPAPPAAPKPAQPAPPTDPAPT